MSRRKYTKISFPCQYYGRIIQKTGAYLKCGTVWEKLRSILADQMYTFGNALRYGLLKYGFFIYNIKDDFGNLFWSFVYPVDQPLPEEKVCAASQKSVK